MLKQLLKQLLKKTRAGDEKHNSSAKSVNAYKNDKNDKNCINKYIQRLLGIYIKHQKKQNTAPVTLRMLILLSPIPGEFFFSLCRRCSEVTKLSQSPAHRHFAQCQRNRTIPLRRCDCACPFSPAWLNTPSATDKLQIFVWNRNCPSATLHFCSSRRPQRCNSLVPSPQPRRLFNCLTSTQTPPCCPLFELLAGELPCALRP